MIPILGRLTKTGRCSALIIPLPALAELGWKAHEPIALSVERGFLVVSSIRSSIDQHQKRAADAIEARAQAV